MTIKTILAPLVSRGGSGGALTTGLRLAESLSAFVEVLHLQPDPRATMPLLAEGSLSSVIEEYIAESEKLAELRRSEAQRLTADAARAAGISTAEGADALRFVSFTGDAAREVAKRGRVADLILLGRVPDAVEAEWRPVREAALIESGRPVLLLPDEPRELVGITAAIAWNGSMEAARATSAALPLLHLAKRILILSGVKDMPVEPSPNELGEWLRRHGIVAERRNVALERWPVGEQLVEEAAASGAQLLVMGAYGHARMRETIFGGATRSVLNESSLPVLLAH